MLLVSVLSWYLYVRFERLKTGQSAPIDVFVFLVWAALLLTPLFNEVNFFGIKLKQEIEETRRQLSNQLTAMESRIQNSVAVSPQFNFGPSVTAPPDAQLPELGQKLDQILNELTGKPITNAVPPQEVPPVDEKVEYLFKTRLQIEKELRRLSKELSGVAPPRVAGLRLLPELVNTGVISNQMAIAVREVYSVCSPAIHGEQVTDAQFGFVRSVAPQLIAGLQMTKVMP